MSEEKKNRQQLACDYIHENYVAFNRLRYDLIAQKVQVCEEQAYPQPLPKRRGVENAKATPSVKNNNEIINRDIYVRSNYRRYCRKSFRI